MDERNSFKSCMVDGDAEVLARARRLRQKALAISLVLEGALIATMLIWPLITPAVLPRQYVFTPTPPYGGYSTPNATRHHSGRQNNNTLSIDVIQQPPVIPSRVYDSPDEPALDPTMASAGAGNQRLDSEGQGLIDMADGARTATSPVAPSIPPPPPKAPVKRSEGVMEAQLIHRVQPIYPAIARNIHLSGTVELRAIIGLDGHVRQLEVLSGSPILVRAAQDAVRQWIYRPTMLNGSAVEVETLITVKFVLE